MKIQFFILLLFTITISNYVHAKPIDTAMVKITIDNISFEENGMLKVFDNNNNEIVRFNRFENKNIQAVNIKNTKIYNEKNELIMTVVISFEQTSLQLHLLNNENQKGLIDMISTAGFGSISTKVNINYYNKNYTMKHSTKMGIGKITVEKELYLDGKLVMSNTNKTSVKESSKGEILVDKNYLNNNRTEAGIWAIIILMMNELGK